ncbi:MAG: sensor histidine kinase [Planctomycetota bacterium]|nr:MAG: sensor histidine kinase [Planctomycetota bacterium]
MSTAPPTFAFARLWLLSLVLVAGLLLVAAWLASPNLGLAGDGQAFAEARKLLPLLEGRARDLARDLAAGLPAEVGARSFPLDPQGELPASLRLPSGRELQDQAVGELPGGPSPASLAWQQARLQFLDGELAQALQTAKYAETLLHPGEASLQARLSLAKADWLAVDGRYAESRRVLNRLLEQSDPLALHAGSSLHWLLYRKLEGLYQAEENEAALHSLRKDLWNRLQSLSFPMTEARFQFEGRRLLEVLKLEEGDLQWQRWQALEEQQELLAAVDPWLPLAPGTSKGIGENQVLFISPDLQTVRIYLRDEVESALRTAWSELLPIHGAFALTSPSADVEGIVLAAPAGIPETGNRWRLTLQRPEVFQKPAERRRAWLWSSTFAMVTALLLFAWFGHRSLRRRAELDRLRRDFIAGVSHELRTPAASISLLATNLAEDRVEGAARRQEYFQALRRDAARLERLVADVLDFSRLERGVRRHRPQPCDLQTLLQDLAEQENWRLEDAGIQLEVDLAADLDHPTLDESAIERAVANLLENGRKYAAEGGWMALKAKREAQRLLLMVEDRGPGIPAAWRAKVVEAFRQGPAPQGGAGLGLALVHETMLAHGGSLELQDRPGGGLCCRLEFPQAYAFDLSEEHE